MPSGKQIPRLSWARLQFQCGCILNMMFVSFGHFGFLTHGVCMFEGRGHAGQAEQRRDGDMQQPARAAAEGSDPRPQEPRRARFVQQPHQ